jgi:hypothetical protein
VSPFWCHDDLMKPFALYKQSALCIILALIETSIELHVIPYMRLSHWFCHLIGSMRPITQMW